MQGTKYDIIVIGAGHAGAEAAWAAARMGGAVALLTIRADKVAEMSCNPAIGGLAKGQIAREVDALGGLMGLAADASGIQFRTLNRSKGPAVWALSSYSIATVPGRFRYTADSGNPGYSGRYGKIQAIYCKTKFSQKNREVF